jgi:hypothetical protein
MLLLLVPLIGKAMEEWGGRKKAYHGVSEIKFAVVSLSLRHSIQREFLFIHPFPISDVFLLPSLLNLSCGSV